MLVRFILITLCLAAMIWHLDGEQRAGRFAQIDHQVMDFMVTNAKGRFEKGADRGEVVLVEFKEADRGEFASWPPPPLDWQMLLKELQTYEPDVLVITTPLYWGQPTPDFAPAVAEALIKFPSVILGVETQLVEGPTPPTVFLGDLENAIPHFQSVSGESAETPRLAALITAPDASVRASSEIGLLTAHQVEGEWRLPYVLNEGKNLLPTLLAQGLARYSRTPYNGSGHRLQLGSWSGAYLNEGIYVPLTAGGEWVSHTTKPVFTINALDLMAGTLADAVSEKDKAALKEASIIVVGTTTAESPETVPSITRQYAQAFSHLLAQPRIRSMSQLQQWLLWGGLSSLVIVMVLFLQRKQAAIAGVSLLLFLAVAQMMFFKSELLWWSPIVPCSIAFAGALLGLLLGRGKSKAAAEKSIAPSDAPAANEEKASSPEKDESPEEKVTQETVKSAPETEKSTSQEPSATEEAPAKSEEKSPSPSAQPPEETQAESAVTEATPAPTEKEEAPPETEKSEESPTSEKEEPKSITPAKKAEPTTKKNRSTRGGRGGKTSE